ncbi:hypothetical protein [Streptomyces sp. NPDC085466]|uniref:hypothetical protein n=1 Tax=Streptomyces sp. NPDC085466 TaxID=3365725 RepID=UPI0037D26367
MRNLIVALLARLLSALTTDSRQPQAGDHAAATPPAPRTEHRPRSPYGLPETAVDGERTVLVRPYLVAHEESLRRRWRRVSLVLAADFGVDLDTRDVHGAGVGGW